MNDEEMLVYFCCLLGCDTADEFQMESLMCSMVKYNIVGYKNPAEFVRNKEAVCSDYQNKMKLIWKPSLK